MNCGASCTRQCLGHQLCPHRGEWCAPSLLTNSHTRSTCNWNIKTRHVWAVTLARDALWMSGCNNHRKTPGHCNHGYSETHLEIRRAVILSLGQHMVIIGNFPDMTLSICPSRLLLYLFIHFYTVIFLHRLVPCIGQ